MINTYVPNNEPLTLRADLAGECPLYIYLSPDKSKLVYSKNIVDLLDSSEVPKPLKVSDKGISFLLQSGVVPPPFTAYEDIFIVGIGDVAKIHTKGKKIELEFSHELPFFNTNRLKEDKMFTDTDEILSRIAKATIDRIDPSRSAYLFHSAGKDSNTIALALAKAGYQDKITLITHKSKGDKDESRISKSIAQKLGFKHEVLYEVDELKEQHWKAIDAHFESSPLPCTDNVTLAYPLYAVQIPEVHGANLIDGMGNDVYMGHVPSLSEYKRQKIAKVLKHGRLFAKHLRSESLLHVATRARSEWAGLSGMSYGDAKNIFPHAFYAREFWVNRDSRVDYLDFRADIRGCIIDQEVFSRKVKNFSDSINANLVLPFLNEQVASYFEKMPEKYLFDRKILKNKLILRDMLKREIGLDSDKLGKLGFSYDSRSVVLQNWFIITDEIFKCKLWDKEGVQKVVKRMRTSMDGKGWSAKNSGNMIYRLYLVSSWLNKSRWIQG